MFALLSKVFGLTNPGHNSVHSNCFSPAKDQVLRTVLLVPLLAAAYKVFAVFQRNMPEWSRIHTPLGFGKMSFLDLKEFLLYL